MGSSETPTQTLVRLIKHAGTAREALESNSTTEFLRAVSSYTAAFAAWQQTFEISQVDMEMAEFAETLEELNELHSELLARAGSRQSDVVEQLKGLVQKSQALRAYVGSVYSASHPEAKRSSG